MTRENRLRVVLLVGVSLWLMLSASLAVEPGKVSWTAQKTCFFRAIAALHPDPNLRNPDYLAEKFVFIPYALKKDYEAARMTMNTYGAGTYYYVNARTLHIDALLKQMADIGATQVIILGAGFDSRGYRFREAYPRLRFFEVDLPATIEWKKEKVIKIFGQLPETVVYAPIDFNTQTLGDVLDQLGYDPKQKSFFIWEGVTMYITEDACRGTLTFIKNHAAAGSTVVLDYILRPVIEGKYQGFYGAARNAAVVGAHGEPYICGWTAREAEEMIRQIGLVVVSDVDADFLTRRYLIGTDGHPDGMMCDYLRIMHARVP
jgi:methyltransferase (TIGR00027 family)